MIFYIFLGGNFVCKVFDMFTPFSVGLFYLLYRCFEEVCLFKPITSRPANSERLLLYSLEIWCTSSFLLFALVYSRCRYVVCKNLLHGEQAICEYLKAINFQLNQLNEEKPELDVLNVSCIVLYACRSYLICMLATKELINNFMKKIKERR